jgi:hypothetical protein
MKTVLYHVSTDDEKWKDVVVEDFRWICTSGLFKKCDKLRIKINERKGSDVLTAEEWVKFFWGRIDDGKKVEIELTGEKPDMSNWIKSSANEDILYVNTNFKYMK